MSVHCDSYSGGHMCGLTCEVSSVLVWWSCTCEVDDVIMYVSTLFCCWVASRGADIIHDEELLDTILSSCSLSR